LEGSQEENSEQKKRRVRIDLDWRFEYLIMAVGGDRSGASVIRPFELGSMPVNWLGCFDIQLKEKTGSDAIKEISNGKKWGFWHRQAQGDKTNKSQKPCLFIHENKSRKYVLYIRCSVLPVDIL
jgi:hypothetical protein